MKKMFSHLTDIKRKCIEDKQRIAKKQSDLGFYPKFLSQLLSFGDDLNPNALIRPASLRLSQKGFSASCVTGKSHRQKHPEKCLPPVNGLFTARLFVMF